MAISQTCILVVIAVYLLGMLVIGIACSKKNKNTDDFYLGGRKLGPLVTAMSAEASDMSSWLLMGLPGVALVSGIIYPGGFAEALHILTDNEIEIKYMYACISHHTGKALMILSVDDPAAADALIASTKSGDVSPAEIYRMN